jgi:hypothetical protein
MQDLMVQEQLLRGTMAYCGLTRAIGIVEAQPEDGWIRIEEDDPATFPPVDEDGCSRYVLLSIANYGIPAIGMYVVDESGGAFHEGDDERTLQSYGLFVNAWRPLPEPYREEDA